MSARERERFDPLNAAVWLLIIAGCATFWTVVLWGLTRLVGSVL